MVENRRGGHLGNGNECAALERGWMRRTARRVRKKFQPVGGGSVLTGSGAEGGRGVDATWRRSRRERDEPGVAWSSMAAWHRRDSGTTAARCHATVENGGVNTTRVDAADRWTGTLRGPDRQRLGVCHTQFLSQNRMVIVYVLRNQVYSHTIQKIDTE
jgi:hypothetical protein